MQTIKIDFDNPGLPQRLDVVENDAQSRFFKAVLYKDGKAYAAPSGATYSIMYRGFGPQNEGWYDTINDGAGKRASCSVSGNVVTCEIARQALRVPGHVSVMLCVTGGNGYMLHGWPIDCNCRNDNYTGGTSVESFFYITQVTNADWTSAIQAWEELKNMIDPTLSLSGKAADSKVVGQTCYRTLEPKDEFATIFGTYNIATDSVKAIASTLGMSKASVDYYYWAVECTSPASANQPTDASADYCQTLIGYRHGNTGEILKFYRYSETTAAGGRQWSPWKQESTMLNAIKILTLGDSFTMDPAVVSYSDYLNQYPQFNVTNDGWSGSTAGTWYNSRNADITSDYDMFFIAFGLNTDTGGIGTIDSTDTTTFYGGFNAILQKIFTVNPTARIMLWCMDAWYTKEKSNAVKALADKYGCEYHSMKAEKQIPVRIDGKFAGVWDELDSAYVNARTKAFAKSDKNHHPTSKGNKYLADYLATIL